MVGMIASGGRRAARLRKKAQLAVKFGAEDLAEVIHFDHYGNLITGLRAGALPRNGRLSVGGRRIERARVFSDLPQGEIFWYENSLGLAEIAANGASAAEKLGLHAGQTVAIEPG
jgi:S-adenosylmethionine hydrolase